MKCLILVALLAVPAISIKLSTNYTTGPQERVEKGGIAEPDQFPFTVGILLHAEARNEFAGGALISEFYVLTGASPLRKVPSATVILGASNINSITQAIPVVDVYVHEKYGHLTEHYDIALVRILHSPTLGPEIQIGRLPSWGQKGSSFHRDYATMTGWGKSEKGSSEVIPIERLHYADAEVISNFDCWFSYPAYLHDSNICTKSRRGTPCDGDEGGPLFITDKDGEFTIIGVVSYQFSLGCNLGWPAVYTRVTDFLTWIEAHSDVVIRDK